MPATSTNELKLSVTDRTMLHLFYSTEVGDASLGTKLLQVEKLNLYPSFKECIECSGPSSIFYQYDLDVNTLQEQFLSEDVLDDVALSLPNKRYSTTFFTVFGDGLQAIATKLSTSKIIEPTEENKKAFPLEYTFPSSFLSEMVRNKLKIGEQTKQVKNDEEISPPTKVRMTPAHKIYDRVLHDPTVDETLFIIGYLDRFSGIKETEFKKFVTLDAEKHYNTSVPFHRVRHFKYKGKLVWERETRLNLIDGNGFLTLE